MTTETAQAPLSYIRKNVALPGENFVTQWGKLTEKDKEDMKQWAAKEMAVLGIPAK
jgi:hypothetical protein